MEADRVDTLVTTLLPLITPEVLTRHPRVPEVIPELIHTLTGITVGCPLITR